MRRVQPAVQTLALGHIRRGRRPRGHPALVSVVCRATMWGMGRVLGAVWSTGLGVLLIATTALATPATAGAACRASLTAGRHTLEVEVAGTRRHVILQVPHVAPDVRPAAVIAFHGYTAHAWQLEETSGLSDLADELGFVVAYPEALGDPTVWRFDSTARGDTSDIELTVAVIDALVEQACVDPERVILAGHSMGGGMASDAACRLAGRVAGVALIAALWLDPPCQPTRPVAVVSTHALDDPVLRYGGGPLPNAGPGAQLLAVEEALASWGARDGCGSTPATTAGADGSAILAWPDCRAPVLLHRLASGGHDWPAMASGLIVELLAGTG